MVSRSGRGMRASNESAGTPRPGVSSLTRSGNAFLRRRMPGDVTVVPGRGLFRGIFYPSRTGQESMLVDSRTCATSFGYKLISGRENKVKGVRNNDENTNGESLGKSPLLGGLFWGFIPEAHRVRFWGGLGPPYRPLLNYDGCIIDRLESGPSWGVPQKSVILAPPPILGPGALFRPFWPNRCAGVDPVGMASTEPRAPLAPVGPQVGTHALVGELPADA